MVNTPHEDIFRLLTYIRATFSTTEKKNYIKAVQCMSKLAPKTPKEKCPGCRNRYDDFVATHINQTFSVFCCLSTLICMLLTVWTDPQYVTLQ